MSAFAASSGCGASHSDSPAPSADAAKRAEIAQERKAASYAPPPHPVVAAAGPTPAARDPNARAALIRAARDLLAYHRRHGTYAVGPVASLHRLDPATRLVDFVDARQGSFFLAVDPPTSTRIWRFDYDHDVVSRVACDAPGDRCPGVHRW